MFIDISDMPAFAGLLFLQGIFPLSFEKGLMQIDLFVVSFFEEGAEP